MNYRFNRFSMLLVWGVLSLAACLYLWLRVFEPQAHSSAPVYASELVMGTNVGYPPFIMTNESGKPTGFDYDLAQAIATSLNKKLVIKDMAFDALLVALQQGKVDMVMGGISLSKERLDTGLFIPYYGEKVAVVTAFMQSEPRQPIKTLSDLAARKMSVCTQAGTCFEDMLSKYSEISLKTLPEIIDLVLEVQYNRCEVGVLDPDTVANLVRYHPWLITFSIALKPEEQVEGFGIGVSKQKNELRKQIEESIVKLKESGHIADLSRKWFS